MDLFGGHEGAHGTHGVPVRDGLKWAIKTTAKSVREPVTLEMWEQHLKGKRPLGIIPIREDSTCSWGSIDLDEYDIDLLEIIKRVEAARLPLVPCRSKSGGLHLFMFFSVPIPAAAAQAILRDLAAQLGLAGCEIFPKQTQILTEKGDVGNWMVMPYFGDTYGGKIKEQVGLKKTGAEMTVEEFLRLAERSRVSEAQAEELARKKATGAKRNKLPPGAGTRESSGVFSDGPPCLQHLSAMGIQRGGQSNALLMMGIYYKKMDPEGWKERLEKANQEYLRPPGSLDGLNTVIRSLSKKDYEYTCKNEPMVSHCNSALCRTRRFGVGDGGNFPIISSLSKLDTEPPLWFVDVEDQRIEATTEQLQNYVMFHRLCMDKLHRCYAMVRPADWLALVSAAMEEVTLIEAPPDVGIDGVFRGLLEEFLTNRARGESRESLLSGRPWEAEDEQRHYFRLQDIQKFLRREDMRELTRSQITQRIRNLGGGHHGFSIKTKYVAVWWIPSSAVNRTPDLDPPAIRESAI